MPPSQPLPEEPHEGSEDDPRRELDPRDEAPVIPPRRYGAADSTEVAVPAGEPTTMDRVIAVSWPIATAVFIILGFTTGWWYLVWVVFLIPAALKAWHRPNDED